MWCGQDQGARHYHQECYSEPLYPGPIPLCIPCHLTHHKGERDPDIRARWRLAIAAGWRPPVIADSRAWFAGGLAHRTMAEMRAFLDGPPIGRSPSD